MKKNELIKTAVLLICVALITVFLTKIAYIVWEGFSVYEVKEIDAKFGVGNGLGFVIDNETLNFGQVMSRGTAEKTIIIKNSLPQTIRIKIIYSGDIREVLYPVEPFNLGPDQEQNVSIIAHAIGEYRNYTGKVVVYYIK